MASIVKRFPDVYILVNHVLKMFIELHGYN